MRLETCGLTSNVMKFNATGQISAQAGGTSMLSSRVNWLRSAILIAAVALPVMAQRDPLFKTEILPVLEKNCFACHGPAQKMATVAVFGATDDTTTGPTGPLARV